MMYGDTHIEDLWVPFFCVSSDLTDASMFVHRSGSLLDAVTASSSPPAVMVPTRLGDHLLCDGSLFNTLPVDLRAIGCGTLVASRVSVPQDKDFLFAQIPTLGQVIRHKLTRPPHPLSGYHERLAARLDDRGSRAGEPRIAERGSPVRAPA